MLPASTVIALLRPSLSSVTSLANSLRAVPLVRDAAVQAEPERPGMNAANARPASWPDWLGLARAGRTRRPPPGTACAGRPPRADRIHPHAGGASSSQDAGSRPSATGSSGHGAAVGDVQVAVAPRSRRARWAGRPKRVAPASPGSGAPSGTPGRTRGRTPAGTAAAPASSPGQRRPGSRARSRGLPTGCGGDVDRAALGRGTGAAGTRTAAGPSPGPGRATRPAASPGWRPRSRASDPVR